MVDPVRDAESGLLNEHYFDAALPNRVANARRGLRPIAIGVLAVAADAAPATVAEALTTALRESDTACRLHDGRYAVLLEDTPEDGARRTLERVVALLGAVPAWAGVACYPAHALEVGELRAMADAALARAEAAGTSTVAIAGV